MKKIFRFAWPDDTLGIQMRSMTLWDKISRRFPITGYSDNFIPL